MHKFYSFICKLNSLIIADPALVFTKIGFHFLLAFLFILKVMIYSVCSETAPVLGNYNMRTRSEEHTSELQSLRHLVCRLLLEKKKNNSINKYTATPHTQPKHHRRPRAER